MPLISNDVGNTGDADDADDADDTAMPLFISPVATVVGRDGGNGDGAPYFTKGVDQSCLGLLQYRFSE